MEILGFKLEKTAKAASDEIKHGVFGDLTLWMVLIAVGGLLYVTRGVLTESNIQMLIGLIKLAMILFTIITVVRLLVNGFLKGMQTKYAYKDGKLDANETKLLTTEVSAGIVTDVTGSK